MRKIIEPEILAKIFKDMPLETQLQALAQYGFQVPTVAEEIDVRQIEENSRQFKQKRNSR